jgi:hypothetical protein
LAAGWLKKLIEDGIEPRYRLREANVTVFPIALDNLENC